MPSARELRESITAARQALIEAIEAAGGRWSEGGGSGPKALTEDVLKAEFDRAAQAAGILGGNPIQAQDWTLDSAGDASQALQQLGPEVDKRFSWAEDRDLSKAQGGTTLEQIMQAHASVLTAAAGQVRGS